MADEDDELELLGVSWARYSWTFLTGLAWAVSLLGWRYSPLDEAAAVAREVVRRAHL